MCICGPLGGFYQIITGPGHRLASGPGFSAYFYLFLNVLWVCRSWQIVSRGTKIVPTGNGLPLKLCFLNFLKRRLALFGRAFQMLQKTKHKNKLQKMPRKSSFLYLGGGGRSMFQRSRFLTKTAKHCALMRGSKWACLWHITVLAILGVLRKPPKTLLRLGLQEFGGKKRHMRHPSPKMIFRMCVEKGCHYLWCTKDVFCREHAYLVFSKAQQLQERGASCIKTITLQK